MRALPEKIGRYTILCELGVGGMSTVYLGRSAGVGNFQRLFAIKMIHENLCELPEFVSLFLNEARIAARIHHPHVVSVYDIDIEDDRYYLSMDYISGETLQLALQMTWNNEMPFPIEIAAHVVACAADGLHAAHELTDEEGDSLGVVHRDVAPQNIILGYDGIVRVMDFGIAKALDRVSLTDPGTLRGSIPYMAPEQVNRQAIDRRSDIFALGVVLWETTVGKRLFQHRTAIGTIARILGMEIPRPSTLRKNYPPRLEEIVMKALERDPERRYQTAEEMGDDLRECLVKEGICTTSSSIRRFVEDRFGERRRQRRAMERTASVVQGSGRVESLPALPVPDQILAPVEPRTEPIDDPHVARRIVEIVRPRSIHTNDFEAQPPTEVTALPRSERSERSDRSSPNLAAAMTSSAGISSAGISSPGLRARARPATIQRKRRSPIVLALGMVLGAGVSIALVTAMCGEPPRDDHDEEVAEILDEADDPPATGSVSITDMAGDGGKKGTVVFYFRPIPPSAKISVNGQPQESDLVVPQSRARYTIRFEEAGYRPQVVTVTAEASRLIEASLEALPKVKKRATRKRRR